MNNSLEDLPTEIVGSIIQYGVMPIDLNRNFSSNLYSIDKWNILKNYFNTYINESDLKYDLEAKDLFSDLEYEVPDYKDINKMFIVYSSGSEFDFHKFGKMIVYSSFNYKKILDFCLKINFEFIGYIILSKNTNLSSVYLPLAWEYIINLIREYLDTFNSEIYDMILDFYYYVFLSNALDIYKYFTTLDSRLKFLLFDSLVMDRTGDSVSVLYDFICNDVLKMILNPVNSKISLYMLYSKNCIDSEYYILFYNYFKSTLLSDYIYIYFLFKFPDKRLLVRLLENNRGELYELFTLEYDSDVLESRLQTYDTVYDSSFESFVHTYILGRNLTESDLYKLLEM
jgi:hypothetical protein